MYILSYQLKNCYNNLFNDFQLSFLLRWRGYSPSHDEWRPLDELNCVELLAEYNNTRFKNVELEQYVALNLLVNVSDSLNKFQENVFRKLDDIEKKGHATAPIQPIQETPQKKENICPYCQKKLCRADVLKKHILIYHPDNAPSKLAVSLAASPPNPPTLSDPSTSSMPIDLPTKIGKVHECSKCDVIFKRSQLLKKHMSRFHKEDHGQKFGCPNGCGKLFHSPFNAKDHGYKCPMRALPHWILLSHYQTNNFCCESLNGLRMATNTKNVSYFLLQIT